MPSPLARAVLPLHLCPLTNELVRMHHMKRHKLQKETFARMLAQIGRREGVLSGRPRVVVTRHSSKEPDKDAGVGSKLAVDCLKATRHGLGWIRDDSPEAIELELRWERAAPSRGQVVVEVWAS